jgi:20S proteasome subunit beta 7
LELFGRWWNQERTNVRQNGYINQRCNHSNKLLHSFLGYVDLQGTTYQSDTIATGFGAYLAQPLLRKAVESREGGVDSITEEEATKVIEDSLRVLYYRDARSLNKV